jgi:hypothetical protein
MPYCKDCGTEISFKKLPNGKWTPCALDGGDHFDLCSKLRFARIKRDGQRFDTEPESGYVWRDPEKDRDVIKRDRMSGQGITGKNYKPTICKKDSCVPPWESCDCSTQTSPQ